MGNLLDVPVIDFNTENLIENNIEIQNTSMQGYRLNMEDCYSIYCDNKYLYVGLYDGHGGKYVSDYLCDNFLKYLSKYINRIKKISSNNNYINKLINECFISFDLLIQKNIFFNKTQGSTAICVVITKHNIIILNCGDSRAVLFNGRDIIYQTTDFKPCNKKEKKRIISSGRKIINDRIDGQINISRCFGDFNFKTTLNPYTHAIISIPEIKIIDINSCKFIVLLTDGITNVADNDIICSYIEYNLQLNIQLAYITENIIKYCLYKKSTDNMTISIIVLYKYNFNNTLNDIEINELNIIKKRVYEELKKNKFKYETYSIFKVLNLIKIIDYDLKYSAGFRYNYIDSLYKKIINSK
ncbi:protein phosphatase 1B [Mythimna separata entomopoxvirus 'L']|uniref:Protein phosphatase 1B n=1 Tax=Mythimna separata entomopoxvirus 'L' TaxID=1293572 RepID=A0A916KQ53_9POXV|nr:protein phosphatase 1B [Mythimna separata entomopoxvirus 'L']CCU56327.1 protein phosphatase 1B [Mythimna separata entomopoxvirus 'L']